MRIDLFWHWQTAIRPMAIIIVSINLRLLFDDTTLPVPGHTDRPLFDEFNNIKHWSAKNKLKINIAKTKEIVFRKRSLRDYLWPQPLEGIEQVQNCKYKTTSS